jgi:hypothetical protein
LKQTTPEQQEWEVGPEAIAFYDYAEKVVQWHPSYRSGIDAFTHILTKGNEQLSCLNRAAAAQVATRATNLKARAAGLSDPKYFFAEVCPDLVMSALAMNPEGIILQDSSNPLDDADKIKAKLSSLYIKVQDANRDAVAKEIARKVAQIAAEGEESSSNMIIVGNRDKGLPARFDALTKRGPNCIPQEPLRSTATLALPD